MTYLEATSSAPEGTDFIAYTNLGASVTFIMQRSDGIWDGVGTTIGVGTDLMMAGIAARRKSLWNADTRQFISGTAAQMLDPQ